MNAVVCADGFVKSGRDGARRKLHDFWLSVSEEGALSPLQRRLFDVWYRGWNSMFPQASAMWDALSQFASPYEFNPLNLNPLRDHLCKIVDFDALRRDADLQLFIAATNVRTGQGEIFRRNVLTADHVMASACLPRCSRRWSSTAFPIGTAALPAIRRSGRCSTRPDAATRSSSDQPDRAQPRRRAPRRRSPTG